MLVMLTGWAVYEDAEHVRDRSEDVLEDAKADPSLLERCFATSSCDWSFAEGCDDAAAAARVGSPVLRDAGSAAGTRVPHLIRVPRARRCSTRVAARLPAQSAAYCGLGAPCAVCRVPIESVTVQLVAKPIISTFVVMRR